MGGDEIMGAWFTHKCDKCNYEVHTDGPWEFYRDKEGKRKMYGHPVPASKEAEESGIAGLTGHLYCPQCDTVSEVILVEFKTPTKDSMDVWSGRAEPHEEYKKLDAVKCPKCGNTDLILGDDQEPLSCPQCENGKLIGAMTMIA
jgi:cytochrome c-type biogenesis protein CcmH/NrfF